MYAFYSTNYSKNNISPTKVLGDFSIADWERLLLNLRRTVKMKYIIISLGKCNHSRTITITTINKF